MSLTSKEVFHQLLAITTISLNQINQGLGEGWLAPTLNTMRSPDSELHLTIDDSSWIASIEQIGYIFGSLLPALFLDTLGRRILIAASAITFFLVWLGITVVRSVWLICMMRLFFGIACGLHGATNMVYIAEITSPMFRGILSTAILSFYYLGILAENVIAKYLTYSSTAAFNTFVGLLGILSVLWTVETPQLLLLKGNRKQAEKTFLRLKGVTTLDEDRLHREFERITQNVEFERTKTTSYKALLTSSVNYKTVVILVLLQSLCDATGYIGIMNFSSIIFSSTSTRLFSPNELTLLLGLGQLIFSLVALLFIGRFSRRTLMIVCFLLISLNQACAAALIYVHEHLHPVPYYSWLIFAVINVYFGLIAIAYPPIFALRGELLPLSIKAFGCSAVIIGKSMMNFALSMSFLHVSRGYGMHVNFILYSVMGVVFIACAYFCVPETRNKSLIRIQDELHERDYEAEKNASETLLSK